MKTRELAACGESRSSARARNLGANLGQEPEANPRFVEDSWTPSRSQRTDRSQSNFHHRLLGEIKNRSSLGLAVLGLVALGFGAVLKAHAGYDSPVVSSNGGPWMNAIPHPACDPADLCAEWPELGGNTVAVCCISSDAVDTDDPGECRRFIYRRPLSY